MLICLLLSPLCIYLSPYLPPTLPSFLLSRSNRILFPLTSFLLPLRDCFFFLSPSLPLLCFPNLFCIKSFRFSSKRNSSECNLNCSPPPSLLRLLNLFCREIKMNLKPLSNIANVEAKINSNHNINVLKC